MLRRSFLRETSMHGGASLCSTSLLFATARTFTARATWKVDGTAQKHKAASTVHWRKAILPFRATRQDEEMHKICVRCAIYDLRGVYVVHAQRGARKSYVAQRCALRSKLWPSPLRVNITYIDACEVSDFHEIRRIVDRCIFIGQLRDCILAFLYAVAALVLLSKWRRWRSGETNEGKHVDVAAKPLWKTIRDTAVNELETVAGLAVFVVVLMLRLVLRRVRVIIVDDPASGVLTGYRADLAAARTLLKYLDRTARTVPIVILTSNDGLAACFTDPWVRQYVTFSSPKVEELPDVLRDVAATRSVPLLHSIDVVTVAAATQHNLEQHALSVTWWIDLAYHAVLRVKHLDAATIKRLSRDRSFLWHTVLFLDCESEPVFRPECLGFSKPLTDEQKMTVAKLVLPLDATDEQRQELVKRLPAKCPRRLALAWALVLTATSGDVEHVKDLRSALTTDIPEPVIGRFGNPYENLIVPLVKAIDEFICAHTERQH